MADRYLTVVGKANELARWEATLAGWRSGEIAGIGQPDEDVVPWCTLINPLPGICTLQSCAGHRRGEVLDGAHVWLWLSRSAFDRFDETAFRLLSGCLVDWVAVHHEAEGKKVATITFFGNERGLL